MAAIDSRNMEVKGMDQAEKLRDMMKMHTKEKKTQARIITVTSGKGGVGKSSISVNLALEFKKQGKRVIIFDADFGLANIEVMIGAIPKYNLADLIYKGKELKDIINKCLSGYEYKILFYYLKGYSYREISEKLNKKEKSIDNAIQRIRKKILLSLTTKKSY